MSEKPHLHDVTGGINHLWVSETTANHMFVPGEDILVFVPLPGRIKIYRVYIPAALLDSGIKKKKINK